MKLDEGNTVRLCSGARKPGAAVAMCRGPRELRGSAVAPKCRMVTLCRKKRKVLGVFWGLGDTG